MRNHLTISGLILALEAWLGIGLFGGGVGIICAIVFVILAIAEKQRRSQHFRTAAIYALLLMATLTLISLSARQARRRAILVISAVNLYRSEHGQYPPRSLTLVSHVQVGISVTTTAGRNFISLECFTGCLPMTSPRNHGQRMSRAE
jgi:hypothetical protein